MVQPLLCKSSISMSPACTSPVHFSGGISRHRYPLAKTARGRMIGLRPGVAPVCFDPVCQSHADSTFLLVVGAPIIVLSLWIAYLISSAVTKDQRSTDQTDEAAKVASQDALYRAVSYTPLLVAAVWPGQRVKLDLGKIGDLKPNDLVVVKLPRPLGVILSWNSDRKQAVVVEFIRGSNADQMSKIASLGPQTSSGGEAVQPGDRVRAVTTTNFVYPTRALFGASPPERHIVLYGADNQSFGNLRTALRKGEAKDGPVVLVLERPKKLNGDTR